MPASSLSAMILAGGQSRRMGRDKALLKLPNGQPLLQRTAQVAQQLTSDILVVTPWPERYRPILPPAVCLVQETVQAPSAAVKRLGPLGGFAQGWSQVRSDWCLLLACDLPYLEPIALQQWWDWLTGPLANPAHLGWGGPTGATAGVMASLVPGVKGWEPLCGYYHRSCLPGLRRHVAGPDRSFQSWLATLPIAAYQALPASMFFNCNTPGDWLEVK